MLPIPSGKKPGLLFSLLHDEKSVSGQETEPTPKADVLLSRQLPPHDALSAELAVQRYEDTSLHDVSFIL